MEELEEIVKRMMDENTPEEEIKKYIKDYKAGKLNGAAEKGATATPNPGASENMVSDSGVFSSELYAKQQADFKSETPLDKSLREIRENIKPEEPDFELNTKMTDQGAFNNFKNRTGREATSVMELTDEDYKSFFDNKRTNVNEELLSDNLKKQKQLENQKNILEQEISTSVGNKEIKDKAQVDLNYVNSQLQDLNDNPIFQLQKKGIENLQQDTYTTKRTADVFETVTNTVQNVLGLVNINVGSKEEIKLDDDALVSAVSSMDKRDLQKLSKGNFTTEEKEAIINNAIVNVFSKKSNIIDLQIENVQKEYTQGSFNLENKLLDIKGQLNILNNSFKDLNNKTPEAVNSYNNLVNSYNEVISQAKKSNVFYKNKFNDLKDKRDQVAADLNIEVTNGILTLPNNFESTKKAKEYSESFSEDGWWNGTRDITNTFVQGMAQTFGKATVGTASWFLTSAGDLFTDQDEYSVFDAFSDRMTNILGTDILAVSKDKKFDILDEEGNFKSSPRNYIKTTAEMLPFSLQIMLDVRRGKITGYKKGLGNALTNLKNKTFRNVKGQASSLKNVKNLKNITSTPLKPISQATKNSIIMAESAFSITVLDNKAEAMKRGLSDNQATVYSGVVSLAEGLVQSIMPDANFFKGVKGSRLLNDFIGNLKTAANKQATQAAVAQFVKGIGLETLEEEFQAGSKIMADLAFGLGLPDSSSFVADQKRLLAGTVMLSSGLGTVGAAKTFSNEKIRFYREMSANSEGLLMQLTAMAEGIQDPKLKQEFRDAQLYAVDVIDAINNSPENVSSEEIDLLVQKKKLLEKKNNTPEGFREEINEQIKAVDEKIKNSKLTRTQEGKRSGRETNLKNLATRLSTDVEILENEDAVKNKIKELKKQGIKVDEKESANYGTFYTTSDGKVGVIVNQQSEKADAIPETTLLHEVSHVILNKSFKANPKLAVESGKSFLEELKNKARFTSVEYQQRVGDYLQQFANGEISEAVFFEEAIALAVEGIESGGIVLDNSIKTRLEDFFRRLLQSVGVKDISFDEGIDIINFIKDYNRYAKTGKGSAVLEKAAKDGIKGKLGDLSQEQKDQLAEDEKAIRESGQFFEAETKKSQRKNQEIYKELQKIDEFEADFKPTEQSKKRKQELLEKVRKENIYEELRQIDEFEADFNPNEQSKNRKQKLLQELNQTETKSSLKKQPTERQKVASDAVQKLFEEKPRDWEGKIIELYKPITKKLVEMRRFKHDDFNVYKDELLSEIENTDRGILGLIRRYDPSRNDSLAAFISLNLPRRMIEVDEKIFPKSFTKQIDEQKTSTIEEADTTIEEAVDESITPTKQEELNLRKKIKLPDEQVEKVREAVRKTFGTKLPPPNSPEFKKVLRKAFDTELFKELKTNVFKSRDDYKFFMSQNWKALYDAIPQQTLNQSFAPFREPVLDKNGKQKREKTPEGERIFRKKNITKEEFLDYFFSRDLGVSTRGTRKDAIVRMMAQELGFDATMETIQEPKVVEKTEFVNPAITPKSIAIPIDRSIDQKFSLRKGVEFNKSNGFKTPDFQTQEGVEEYADHIQLLAEAGVFESGLLTPSMLVPTVKFGTIEYVKNSKEAEIIESWIKRSNPTTKQIEQKDTDSPQRKKNSGIQQGEIKLKSYLRALIKDIDFGPKTTGTNQRADQVFGNTFKKFNKISSLPGFKQKVKDFNKNNSKDFFNFFMGIRKILSDSEYSDLKNKIGGSLYFMLESSINQRNHPAARGAKFIGFYKGGTGKIKWEHAVPNAYAFTNLFEKALKLETDKEFEDYLKAIQKNYTLIALPEKLDEVLNSQANSKFTMPNVDGVPWNPFKDFYWQRYLNNEIADLIAKKLSKTFSFSNIEMIEGGENPFKTNNAEGFSETKASKRKKSSFFAKMIEEKTGILAKQKLSAVTAAKMGEENGKIDFFIAPSAEDFMGLMYKILSKGKLGDKQKKWVDENIMKPYAIAIEKITTARSVVTNSFQAIKKDLNITEKDLKKKIPNSVFTQEDALRVYIWAKQGLKIPGLLKKEQKELVSYINGKSNLVKLANNIIKINNVDFKTPTSSWQVGNLGTDMLESLNTTRRAEYLEEWQNNVDDIFSENNLNKLEAAFGKPYRLAVENSLQRMKTGRNRDVGRNNLVNRFVDWTNGATGAIMFFNTRSALLQLISAGNFINFGDNNIVAAAKAFSNQKQYWSDVTMLFNSEFLVNRRDGLKMSVNEADIADVAREKGVRGLINKLLKLGFTPTQVADSIAIATGGATFYRNRYNALVKGGMNKADAQAQAMRDFRETAEESQQSSRPDKISQQQASELGRLILAFANTPSQYARIIKKAALDLKNRRGNDKENISKILYYTFAQNLIFNALQNAMFAVAFGDVDDEDKLKKEIRVANGMADSLLRGMGIQGAILSIVKNAAIRIYKKEYGEIIMELFRISPPISSKVRKIERASNLMKWEGDEIFEQGLTIDNPAIEITGKTIEALTNLPLDRAIKKITNLKDATDSELEFYQRLALIGGWNKWDLGIQEKKEKNKTKTLLKRKVITKRRVIE